MLHYAPDNASLIVRLALEALRVPYRTALVDRAAWAQRSARYLALNPNGLIPALETPDGPLFETGAILLWLTDRHGQIGPAASDPARGGWLKWLFFVANTLHPALRQTFYPGKYVAGGHESALRTGLQPVIAASFDRLEDVAAEGRVLGRGDSALDFYVAACLRWRALYPAETERQWYTPGPALNRLCAGVEALPACAALIHAEGLGTHPFTAPELPQPPEGSAT